MEAPERYQILVRYGKADDFVPAPSGYSTIPDGGYFEWDEAVELMARMRHDNPVNEYMIMPIIADPI